VDREDLWVKGFVFPVPDDSITYEDSFNRIKRHLVTDEFIASLTKKFYLDDVLETYTLEGVRWECGVVFVFVNENQKSIEFRLGVDYVDIVGEDHAE
jgi:hypothetical protein